MYQWRMCGSRVRSVQMSENVDRLFVGHNGSVEEVVLGGGGEV